MIDQEPFNVLNSQTAFLSTSGDYYFPPHDGHLELARRQLGRIRLLATVERFARSLQVGAHFLHPLYPAFDWKYQARNVTAPGADPELVERRCDELAARFGSIARFLIDSNQLDVALWRSANEEIERRAGFMRSRIREVRSALAL